MDAADAPVCRICYEGSEKAFLNHAPARAPSVLYMRTAQSVAKAGRAHFEAATSARVPGIV